MRKIMMCVATALAAACSTTPAVQAVRETAAVSATGDAADDPAIWVAPDPAQSLVIGTQKQGGLYVFDLNGAIVQEAPGGRPNNVDIREGFPWAEGASPIVAASDRTDNSIVIWRFNAETRRLEEAPRGRIATGFAEVYGFCLGRMGADYVALVTDRDSGDIGVWRITQTADGVIGGERISTYSVGSIAEGCVFDDEAGVYYLAQETVGVWRAATADASGESKRLIDTVGRGGNLVADVEGLSCGAANRARAIWWRRSRALRATRSTIAATTPIAAHFASRPPPMQARTPCMAPMELTSSRLRSGPISHRVCLSRRTMQTPPPGICKTSNMCLGPMSRRRSRSTRCNIRGPHPRAFGRVDSGKCCC
jgi:hypothetical protein